MRQQFDGARTEQVGGFGAALRLPCLEAQPRENRAAVVSLAKMPKGQPGRQEVAPGPTSSISLNPAAAASRGKPDAKRRAWRITWSGIHRGSRRKGQRVKVPADERRQPNRAAARNQMVQPKPIGGE